MFAPETDRLRPTFSRQTQLMRLQAVAGALILGARCIVQSIVDADTAPAKVESYRQLLTTKIADDAETRQTQFDQNPGLWLRVHPSVRSLILPNVLAN